MWSRIRYVMGIQIFLILDKSPNKRDTFKILKKILFMGNRKFSPAKLGIE
ncbi:hypothetical protein HanXRQr2_Chr11g0479561 [Helianthus annuus]|uniref:Uncharacterized protein n=1 Tax=Helianthus annuus TaxID=4232 RepID=A0A9K3MZ41_HELAN|nr:hypothetical protein HanXRQr2_Chr11g0479561 [Helianthus annuus]KAJ0508392.1 hypothetical protein HanIR_Chr11g0516701 [Helianthus annuus]KAJ0874278.1 hypothetical protein HanPSC8_Chr11g0462241 [Helianthus annuus]